MLGVIEIELQMMMALEMEGMAEALKMRNVEIGEMAETIERKRLMKTEGTRGILEPNQATGREVLMVMAMKGGGKSEVIKGEAQKVMMNVIEGTEVTGGDLQMMTGCVENVHET